ncbi:Helix-turn-helix transcriptional regulator [Elizabethkingia occulta]
MKKIKPINSDKFFTSISVKNDSKEILYYDYFQSTIEQIRNYTIGPYFWIISNNSKMKIESISDAVEQLTPYTKEEWMASAPQFFIEAFHPEDRAYLMAAFAFAVKMRLGMDEERRKHLRINFYARMLDVDCNYRWILLNSPKIYINEMNEIEASLTVIYDLSHLNIFNFPLLTAMDQSNRKVQYYKHFDREIKKVGEELSAPVITKREKEILSLMIRGFNTPQISQQLFISYYTVENHKRNLRKKTQTKTSSELIAFIIKYNLLFI